MRVLKIGLVCGAVALAAAGCKRKEEQQEQLARPAGAVEATQPKSPAPKEAPKRKSGLWEQRISLEGVDFVQVTRICLDPATDLKISWWGNEGARSNCEKNLISRQTDGAWRFSSVCDMGSGGVTTTSGVATGDFDSKYQVTAESSTKGAAVPQMNGIRKVTIDAQWQGACPKDMVPGDMELPGGTRLNMVNVGTPNTAAP